MISETMQQVLAIRAERAQQMAREQADAQAYWQRRKVELGIDHDIPMSQKLERIRADRTQAITQVPERLPLHELAREARTLERSIAGLQRYSAQLRQELSIEGHYREDYQRPQSGQRSAERLLAAGTEHGLPRDHLAERAVAKFARTHEEEPQQRAALRIRLFREEERERDQGWGF